MKKIERIKIGSDNKLFDWVLMDKQNATWPEKNTDMIRQLVKRHNDMADIINLIKDI